MKFSEKILNTCTVLIKWQRFVCTALNRNVGKKYDGSYGSKEKWRTIK